MRLRLLQSTENHPLAERGLGEAFNNYAVILPSPTAPLVPNPSIKFAEYNCYVHALGAPEIGARDIGSLRELHDTEYVADSVMAAFFYAAEDGLEPIAPHEVSPEKAHIVGMFVSIAPYEDFHFVRLHQGNVWSNKPGNDNPCFIGQLEEWMPKYKKRYGAHGGEFVGFFKVPETGLLVHKRGRTLGL